MLHHADRPGRLLRLCLLMALAAVACPAQDSAPRETPAGRIVLPLPCEQRALLPYSRNGFTVPVRPRVGLALSGGGARGLAQIGVLRAFEEDGIPVDIIAGTSIGSIVGGLYAAGYSPDRLSGAVHAIDWDDLLRLSDQSDREHLLVDQKPVFDRSLLSIRIDGLRPVLPLSVSNGQRLANLLNELVVQGVYHASHFDQLRIPFRAVTTDLYSGRRVVIDSGSLAEALHASSTVPVLYAAVPRDSMALVDGGLRTNIPVDVLRDAGCVYVVAVNTSSPPRNREAISNPIEALDQVMTVMMQQSNAEQLRQADLVIMPDIAEFSATAFTAADSLIARGYRAAKAMGPALRSALDSLWQRRACAAILREYPSLAGRMDAADSALCAARIRELRAMAESDAYDALALVVDTTGRPVFRISSTPRVPLHSVTLRGNSEVPDSALRHAMAPWLEQPLGERTVRGLCDAVISRYRAGGLSFAHIDSVGWDRGIGTAMIRVEEGRIDSIIVRGNTRTDEVVIRREFPFREGDVFRIAELRNGLNNLTGLALFHQVSFDVTEDMHHPAVIISVEERPSQMLQFGALVNNERNAQLAVELRDANFFGTGSSMALQYFGGLENRRYRGVYGTNRLFYTHFSFTAQVYYDLRDFNAFTDGPAPDATSFERIIEQRYRRVAYGGAASVGVYARRFGQLSGTIRAERQSLRGIDLRSPAALPIDEEQAVISLAVGTTIDTQDRWPYPHNGVLFTAAYTSAQRGLGSDIAFTRLEASYDQFVPAGHERVTLHPRILFQYGDRTMPKSEEFHLGGMPLFYGMRENEFTGRQLLLGSLEIRYMLPVQILFDSFVSARYDIGRTWAVPEHIVLADLRHGAGLALSLDSPIGPVDFGVGQSFLFVLDGDAHRVLHGPLIMYFSIGVEL